MVRNRSFLRNPFSFLFARSAAEDRLAGYVIREHRRGRALAEILEDPYVRNRATDAQRKRILQRPDVIRAVGEGVAAEHLSAES
ncbi:MAG TPA: hypothetical protein VFI37_12745 [Gaiellaceae bacterium]|nr:hypothetical protein [Gaiellaceae bacterium]